MKVLITGGTGGIGHEVLLQLLQHPRITSVVSLSRRDIPASSSLPNPHKFKNVIVADFANWTGEIMETVGDADAMFWGMGTNDSSTGPNLDWPLAFQNAMLKARKETPGKARFKYVHLSGRFGVQDQNARLWFLDVARKVKGRVEIASLQIAKEHKETWQTVIIKPGGVIIPSYPGRALLSALVGNMGIKSEELAAYVADLIAMDNDVEGLVSNETMLEEGRALLKKRSGEASG